MTIHATPISHISLDGLEIAPSQVRGAMRLVPLLRRGAPGDLRLARRNYRDDLTIVATKGEMFGRDPHYVSSYAPHGMVIDWSEDGSPVVSNGAQIAKDGEQLRGCGMSLRVLSRMAKREAANRLRFLPLHLAMEGFLSLFFSGPEIAWQEFSRKFRNNGFESRWELAVSGRRIDGLEEALRVFEIHEDQVGMLVFVADEMASAFVVSHPDDYRALHETLLLDFYGELLYQYALLWNTAIPLDISVHDEKVTDLASLRAEITRVRDDWGKFHGFMASDLIGRTTISKPVYQAGPFALQRFITTLDPKIENHIGEAIVRDDGMLEYLKTFRLSGAQTRRAYLLSQLSAHEWQLDAAAEALQTTRHELVHRLERAGFGYILNPQVLAEAQTAMWKKRRVP
ncbi:hypothetical protein CCAX7_37460 [Capsulimonas corticalis]|uniref:ARG and Rhodanese-Phosphatase-superfamily-associated domain-containing protein n=1 Tax=Capsulimonas corticalis TaxID=2219043 RepID=A0A402D177_9BACT|nr:hypothetical protein [Capsulimonas corticalis]BDI31695.1 hypothetical protein CCAX7_37460 [Capsulimonas corticalis]